MTTSDYSRNLKIYAENAALKQNSQIASFLVKRNISRTFHFSHIDNLESIRANGWLSRRLLVAEGKDFQYSDEVRFDELEDAICSSLTSPNLYMLGSKIKQRGNVFILFEIPANSILYRKFACFPSNAARSDIRKLGREKPQDCTGVKGLSRMFLNREIRSENRFSDAQPTDQQAELAFFDPLPFSLLRKIHVPVNLPTEKLAVLKGLESEYPGIEVEYACKCRYFENVDQNRVFSRWEEDWE